MQIFPSFTNSGRVRAELDIDFTWELISDLFWRLSFYNSYDSDPVVVDAENNDYGVTTSLGWSFRAPIATRPISDQTALPTELGDNRQYRNRKAKACVDKLARIREP